MDQTTKKWPIWPCQLLPDSRGLNADDNLASSYEYKSVPTSKAMELTASSVQCSSPSWPLNLIALTILIIDFQSLYMQQFWKLIEVLKAKSFI